MHRWGAMTDRRVFLDSRVYTSSGIASARRAYDPFCAFESGDNQAGVSLSIRLGAASPPHAVEEFLNYALCASIEELLERATTS